MGKPGKWFFECLKQVNPDIKPSKCLMIGDRLNSDIEFAHNNNIKYSILVQSGTSSLEDIKESIEKGEDQFVPTHYCKDLGELNQFLNKLLESKQTDRQLN